MTDSAVEFVWCGHCRCYAYQGPEGKWCIAVFAQDAAWFHVLEPGTVIDAHEALDQGLREAMQISSKAAARVRVHLAWRPVLGKDGGPAMVERAPAPAERMTIRRDMLQLAQKGWPVQ